MAQDRKVFVGGVPQDLNQDDLYAIFSEYAGVKKAWLQKCRATDDNGNSNPPQNHRGFGFVIFHDPNAIEELLGGNASRFIVLRNGAKLEVKRALSSSKMSGLGAQRAEAAQQELLSANASGARSQTQQQTQTQQPTLQQQQQQQQPPLRAASVASPPGTASIAQAADLRPRHLPTALASTSQVRPGQAVSWTGPNGESSVLGQLSLMPNPAAYTAPQRTLGMGVPGIMAGATSAVPDGMSQPYRPVTMVSNTRYLMPAASSTAAPGAFLQQQQRQQQPQQQQQPQPPQAPAPPGLRPAGSGNDLADSAAKQLREAVIHFYKQYKPDKLEERDFVDQICSYYLGRESQLDDDLRRKYGVGLQMPLTVTPVIAPQAPPQAPPPPAPGHVAASMPATGATASTLSGGPPMSPLTAQQHRLLQEQQQTGPPMSPVTAQQHRLLPEQPPMSPLTAQQHRLLSEQPPMTGAAGPPMSPLTAQQHRLLSEQPPTGPPMSPLTAQQHRLLQEQPPTGPPMSPLTAQQRLLPHMAGTASLGPTSEAVGQPPMSPLTATQHRLSLSPLDAHRLLPHMASTGGLSTTYTVLPATLQGASESTYAQHPWLQPGMQGVHLRGPAIQQAPLPTVPAPALGGDGLSGFGATGTSPATAPAMCQGSSFSVTSTSAATNGVSLPRGSSSCSSGAFVVANGTGNDDGHSLQGSERSAEPSQEAEDDGFEISVSVAEAIVGKGNSAVAQGREWLEGSLW